MRPVAKWGIAVVLVFLLAGSLAWVKREAIALRLVGMSIDRRMPIGPHQEITWSTGVDPEGRAPGERPPNVVLILADDLGWNDLTFNGGGVASGTVPTPHIDSIAAEGVSFTNGYAANATCAPSRAALMSGRYGTRFGFEFTPTPPGMMQLASIMPTPPGRLRETIVHDAEGLPFEDMGMPASEITLAELLAERGYHTVHIGKWHLGRSHGMAPHDQGFDESLLMASGLYLPEDHPDVVNSKQDFDPIDRFLWAAMRFAASCNGGTAFEPDGYLTDYYTEQAVRVIEANKDRPFFLYLAHWAPHTPLQAAREDYEALSHIENHRERVYAAMIRGLDRGVGRVLDALERNGLEREHARALHLRQRRRGLHRPPRGEPAVPRLEDHVLRRRHPRAVLREVAGAHSGGDEGRRSGASLRHVRDGRGRRRRADARRSHDGRRRSGPLRHRRGQRRAPSSALLAQRRVADARSSTAGS